MEQHEVPAVAFEELAAKLQHHADDGSLSRCPLGPDAHMNQLQQLHTLVTSMHWAGDALPAVNDGRGPDAEQAAAVLHISGSMSATATICRAAHGCELLRAAVSGGDVDWNAAVVGPLHKLTAWLTIRAPPVSAATNRVLFEAALQLGRIGTTMLEAAAESGPDTLQQSPILHLLLSLAIHVQCDPDAFKRYLAVGHAAAAGSSVEQTAIMKYFRSAAAAIEAAVNVVLAAAAAQPPRMASNDLVHAASATATTYVGKCCSCMPIHAHLQGAHNISTVHVVFSCMEMHRHQHIDKPQVCSLTAQDWLGWKIPSPAGRASNTHTHPLESAKLCRHYSAPLT